MCCSVTANALMVRVGTDGYTAALAENHVRPMEMGGGRRPCGFVLVDPAAIESDDELHRWIKRARTFVSTLPVK